MTTNMTYNEYMSYASEIGTLEHLLDDMPEHMRIERIGIQSRLKHVRNRLEGVPVPAQPRKISVTFGGEYVIHSYGIDANFGTEAITLFSDAIRLTAAGLTGKLKATGQIPRSALSQPIITGVALGSFQFVMELPETPQHSNGSNYPEMAVKLLQDLLRLAKEDEEDGLALVASEIHPRAITKVMTLLDFIRKKQAYFAISYQDNQVRFDNSDEIEDAATRISNMNAKRTKADSSDTTSPCPGPQDE